MSYLEPVKAGDSLSAVNENKKIAAINDLSDRLDTLHISNSGSTGLICTIKNPSDKVRLCGDILEVDGLRSTGDKDKLLRLYMNSGIQLQGKAPTSTSSVVAFLLEAAPKNGIVRCFVPGVIGALVTISDTGHGYCNPSSTGLVSSAFGQFRIIAKSTGTGAGFAILLPVPLGHVKGKLGSKIEGTSGNGSTATVTLTNGIEVPDVGCPMLRADESIEKNMDVILSFNILTRKWEIIEAQCPEPEEEEE